MIKGEIFQKENCTKIIGIDEEKVIIEAIVKQFNLSELRALFKYKIQNHKFNWILKVNWFAY